MPKEPPSGYIFDAEAVFSYMASGSNLKPKFLTLIEDGKANISAHTRREIADIDQNLAAELKSLGLRVIIENDETDKLWNVVLEGLNPVYPNRANALNTKAMTVALSIQYKLKIFSGDHSDLETSLPNICESIQVSCSDASEI